MRRSTLVTGFGMIVSVAFFLVASYRDDGMAAESFTLYRSQQPQLPVSFEYPADWQVEDSSGTTEKYTQVQVYGPPSLETRLRTYMVVRAVPPKAEGGRFAGLGEMVEEYQKTLMPSLRIDQAQETVVLDVLARRLDISGTLSLPWKSKDPHPVPVKSQRIFLEKDGRLYELSWMATPEASQEVERAFSHLLDTLAISSD